jgi:hypothetical protein
MAPFGFPLVTFGAGGAFFSVPFGLAPILPKKWPGNAMHCQLEIALPCIAN